MKLGLTNRIFKQLGIGGLVLSSVVVVGLFLILLVPTLPMKLLGIGVVILAMLGLTILFYKSGYVTGKDVVFEEKKPSTPLPKNIKVDEIRTDKGKIKTFESVEPEQAVTQEELKSKTKSPRKKTGFIQGFIDFVSKSEEKPYFPEHRKKKAEDKVPAKESHFPQEDSGYFADSESSFKIISRVKTTDKDAKAVEPKLESPQKPSEPLEPKAEEVQPSSISAVEEPKVEAKEVQAQVEIEQAEETEMQETVTEKVPAYRNRRLEVEISAMLPEDTPIKGEPIKEMKLLFERLLTVIGTVTKTNTSAFFLVNRAKKELVLQAIVSHTPNALKNERKIPLNGDLVSQIVEKGKPEIIDFNNSSAELDLLPYYAKPVGTKTFIAVPLKLHHNVIGVLCADSTSAEAFDDYTMNFFMYYSRIFSFFLESYTEKYELLLHSQILGLYDVLRKGFYATELKFAESLKAIVQSILNLYDFTTFGVCLFDFSGDKYYKVKEIRSTKNLDLHLKEKKVALNSSLLGKALLEKRTMIAEFDERTIRINPDETRLKRGVFVAIPIKTKIGIQGAMFGWTEEPNPVVNQQIKILEDLAFALGLCYENDHLSHLAKQSIQAVKEAETDEFTSKIKEEWKRASDFGIPFSVCKIAIDNYIIDNSLIQEFEAMSKKLLLNYLLKLVHEYDFVCNLEDNNIGVIFVGRNGKDTKLMLESLRKNIAQTALQIKNQNVFFTISVGVAQFSPDTNVSKLIENVDKALEISLSRKNTVTLY